MKKTTLCGLLSAATIACAGLSAPAFATPLVQTIDLGTVFTGTAPNGDAPWLVGTFMYQPGATTGTLTLQAYLTDGGSGPDGNFVQSGPTGWGFNVAGLSSLTCVSGECASSTGFAPNSGSIGGGFTLGFYWTSSNRFEGTDIASYTLTFANALGNTSPFGPNADGWTSFAHVQGITRTGCDNSGWIVDNATDGTGAGSKVCDGQVTPPPVAVPEPSSLGILGLGTLLLAGFIGLRRRFS